MRVVNLKRVTQTGCKLLGRTDIASFQKLTGQDATPQRNLIEPGAMFGRKVEHMLMSRVAQKGPSLPASAQILGDKGPLAPLGDQTAEVEAPVGIAIIHHPVVTVHVG